METTKKPVDEAPIACERQELWHAQVEQLRAVSEGVQASTEEPAEQD